MATHYLERVVQMTNFRFSKMCKVLNFTCMGFSLLSEEFLNYQCLPDTILCTPEAGAHLCFCILAQPYFLVQAVFILSFTTSNILSYMINSSHPWNSNKHKESTQAILQQHYIQPETASTTNQKLQLLEQIPTLRARFFFRNFLIFY